MPPKQLHGILAHCRWRLHSSVINGIINKYQGDRANGLSGLRLVRTQPAASYPHPPPPPQFLIQKDINISLSG